jgi:protein SCO1/2
MMDRRRLIRRVAGAAALAASGGFLVACSDAKSKVQFHSVDVTGASYAKNFDLTDFNGKERTLADYKGDVVAVFFGYTHCPDVCPTTLAELAQVRKKLGSQSDKFQVLFVSLDPERDTPTVLKSYLGAFDKSFVGLYTPSISDLPKLAKSFKIFYQKVDGKASDGYSVDHSAATFIYDPQGRLRLYSPNDNSVANMTSDVKLLLKGA